jgi:hypothetical protein
VFVGLQPLVVYKVFFKASLYEINNFFIICNTLIGMTLRKSGLTGGLGSACVDSISI